MTDRKDTTLGVKNKIENQVEQLADQLSESISGNFDFSVFIESADYSVQKLSIMVNFLLQKIREHLQEIAASSAYTMDVIASMNDMVVITDSDHTIKSVSGALARKLGIKDLALVGRPINHVFPEINRNTPGKAEFQIEDFIASDKGERTPVLISAAKITTGEGKQDDVVFTAKDLTKYKALESEVLKVSEREQRRVSYNLHDGLGQGLAGIAYMCESLSKKSDPQTIAEIKGLINQCIGQTKALARDLYPIELEKGGLVSGLNSLASNARELFNINCRFECDADPVLFTDFATANHLYYIAQEAISNAVRHGKAKNLLVELRSEKKHFSLKIGDDGIGIDPAAKEKKGMGLQIMSYRAHAIGCSLNIERQTTGGTMVCCFN